MQRKVLGMLLVGLATVLLVGIGADFASYTATRTATIAVVADDQELIGLVPVQSYAYLKGDGTLAIDISTANPGYAEGKGTGISPYSTYDIDKVFNVSNKLWAGDSTNKILVTVTATVTSPAAAGDLKLYSKKDIEGRTSSGTASNQIKFYLLKGDEGDVGLKLVGGSSKDQTIIADIKVDAVASP